jgi:hypothetical protein
MIDHPVRDVQKLIDGKWVKVSTLLDIKKGDTFRTNNGEGTEFSSASLAYGDAYLVEGPAVACVMCSPLPSIEQMYANLD